MRYATHHGRRPRPDLYLAAEGDGERPRGPGGPRGGRHRGYGRGPGGPGGFDPRGGFGPGMGGPGGPGRPGFGRGRRRRRGDVRLAALLLIAEAPRNGYQIIQELAERTDGRWKPSSGAVYPALSQLEDEGLIRPAEQESGKVFEITEAGRVEAESVADQPAPWETPDADEDPAHALWHGMRQVGQAVGVIAQSGDAELAARAVSELDDLKRRLFRLLADAED